MSRRESLASTVLAILVFAGCGMLCAAASAAGTATARVESTAPAVGDVIKLPAPDTSGGGPINAALMKRRTIRSYEDAAVSIAQLSQLLWAAQGVTDAKTGHRTAPSAHAMYPLDVYAVTAKGIYRYLPADHSLKAVKTGDHRSEITGQAWAQKVAVQLVIVGIPRRMKGGGEKTAEWIDYEAGAAAQNVLLEATAMGLGSGTIGIFDSAKISGLLDVARNSEVIIVLPVGKTATPR